ncbi:adenine phosphoribosyltransferase [Streptomyces mayteni]
MSPRAETSPVSSRPALADLLLSRIRDVPDYPRPGVLFKDITPLLADPEALTALTDELAAFSLAQGATKVVGLEARGFILAAPVAVRAGMGFVPVRKAGKLPGATLAQSYELEYGTAEMEIHAEDLTPDDRVLIIDDVLATGGTAEAAIHLIRRTGAQLAGLAVLMELTFLSGRDRVTGALGEAPYQALLTV